jgi:hypothetical protein
MADDASIPPYAHPELILNRKCNSGHPILDVVSINPLYVLRHPACSCNIVSEPHILYLQKEFRTNFQPVHSGIHSALFLNDDQVTRWKAFHDDAQHKAFFISQFGGLNRILPNYSFDGWHSREAHVRNGTNPVPVKLLVYHLDIEADHNRQKFQEICSSLVKQGSLLNTLHSNEHVLQYDVLNALHILRRLISDSRRVVEPHQRIYDINLLGSHKRQSIFQQFSSLVNIPVPNDPRKATRWLQICSMSEDAWNVFQKIAFVKYDVGNAKCSYRNLNNWERFSRLSPESVSRVSRFFFLNPQGFPNNQNFDFYIEVCYSGLRFNLL